MKRVPILWLLPAFLSLTACGGSPGAGAKVPPLPEAVREACPHPAVFLNAGDWEIMAGRIGDALIDCEGRRGVAVGYADAVTAATKPDYWSFW